MKIGIVDAEIMSGKKHRFPNLALMKISAFYKAISEQVRLLLSYDEIGFYDKVYVSKVFDFTTVPGWVLSALERFCADAGYRGHLCWMSTKSLAGALIFLRRSSHTSGKKAPLAMGCRAYFQLAQPFTSPQ